MSTKSRVIPESAVPQQCRLVDILLKKADPVVQSIKDEARKGIKATKDAWYQASYDAFLPKEHRAPETPEQFLRIVAYAYAWVPTIGTLSPAFSFPTISHAIREIAIRERQVPYNPRDVQTARRDTVQAIQAALGTKSPASVVVASKILHFWDRSLAPMIDRNIAKAWKRLAADREWKDALGEMPGFSNLRISLSPGMNAYLKYWEFAYQLRKCSEQFDYRRLDELMFCYGRQK